MIYKAIAFDVERACAAARDVYRGIDVEVYRKSTGRDLLRS